jgi:flagellar protein FliO/FliZ
MTDGVVLLKFGFAFVFVISLMLLLAYVIKRMGLPGAVAVPGTRRRLKVVEFLPLDARRRLVLIRRDDREHLLVLGPSGETVVESDISAAVDGKVVELKNVQG